MKKINLLKKWRYGLGILLFSICIGMKPQQIQAEINSGILTINYVPGYGIELWQDYGPNKKATGRKLPDGSAWRYSAVKKLHDVSWYQVGRNQWVASNQGATPTVREAAVQGVCQINYVPNYGIAVWQDYSDSKKNTGQILKHGTKWRFFKKAVDQQGNSWYQVGNKQWISGDYLKISQSNLVKTTAEIWDPNFAFLQIAKNSPVYYSGSFNASKIDQVKQGALVAVTSTILNGNLIWYELSTGGWLPSSVVEPVVTNRSRLLLGNSSRKQIINRLIATAKLQLGKPYVWDSKGPNSYDCSGLMQYVFKQVTGQNIGSWTVPQEAAGVKVPLNKLQAGDLLFWGASSASYHVALYLGNNQYLNALRPGTTVRIDSISASFAPSFGVRIFPN